MRYFIYSAILSFLFISCGGSRPSVYHYPGSSPQPVYAGTKSESKQSSTSEESFIINAQPEVPEISPTNNINYQKLEIIDVAKSFQGTRYRAGGTTRAGMDCSGLICTAFQTQDIQLPRTSGDMASEGIRISLKQVEPGDLIFFKTNNKRNINHVGLVVESERGDIRFIHSSTSQGVIISSLDETYWKKAFAEARRII